MKKVAVGFLIVLIQFGIPVLFFENNFDYDTSNIEIVSTVYNANLDKIATSVSLLFDEESDSDEEIIDLTLSELPSVKDEKVVMVKEEVEKNEETPVSMPLYSIDASKYRSNEGMGFKVTEGNKKYDLSDHEFDVVVAVVAGEFDINQDDALGVVSVILNRCDSPKWNSWTGNTPYSQVVAKGQFEVYFAGMYLAYMPGGKYYGGEKYNVAKQAVIDGLNGIRNNNYLGFRASWVTGYSDKYIVSGGNRYGYN